MKRGFTLIELLVVIAIIAILAAILFPVFARAREKARQTQCLSNHKELALSILMYVQDYDEHLPFTAYYPYYSPVPSWLHGYGYARWWEVVMPYIKNMEILHCESYKATHAVNPNSYGYNGYGLGYMPSWWLTQSGTKYYRTYGCMLAQVPNPSEVILTGPRYCWSGDSVQAALTVYWCLPWVHNGGDNYSFVDGHAKWMKLERVAGPMWGDWNAIP
jgi:prepilin-type N-terminal cleavage/methylation domain-containing protein/prepilin-type processing-associated H-X9-DG protein